jgi:integrase
LLSPELAAGIRRVKGAEKLGVRLGNWLTAEEARPFWQSPAPNTLKGKRDRAILAVLLGCGLRRRELADLDFNHLQQREEHWAIVDLVGKGGHIRTVPVPEWVKATIDLWVAAAGISAGRLFRCVCRKDRMNITGARWSLAGAEAVLRLRALRASDDFDAYWEFHEHQEYERNHASQYADHHAPEIVSSTGFSSQPSRRDTLKIVKKKGEL